MNRFALGDRDNLSYNEDGSLDVYIQSTRPKSALLANWLPIPKEGSFSLILCFYWPKEAVLDGQWDIPFVVPVER